MAVKKVRSVKRKPAGIKSKVSKLSKRPTATAIKKAAKLRKRSAIELIVYNWLTEDKVKFKKEKVIGRCHVDIFLEPNIVVEVNGCYWHRNKCCYPEDTPENQDIRIKDARRYSFFRAKGMEVHILKECEIHSNPAKCRAYLRKLYPKDTK